ncbi:MAG: hypothetical protein CSA18_03205 [Deltaproteobacteria bacterium]|nr:MAG: hypothetical protein CSA18_03205 [Deltaproteobacteria bacterium]
MNKMEKSVLMFFLILLFYLIMPLASHAADCKSEKLSNKGIFVLEEAKALEQKDQLDKAIKVLRKYVDNKRNKDHHYLEYFLGQLYVEKKDDKKSLKAFEKACKLCPEFLEAWQNAGKILFDLQEYAKAADYLEKAYYLSKEKDTDIIFAAALAYNQSKQSKKAFKILDKITRSHFSQQYLTAYTSIGISLKKGRQVLKRLDRALLKKEEPYILKLAANTALSLNDYKKGVKYLTIYSMANETSAKEDRLTGDLYRALNAPFKAAPFYKKALSKKNDPKILKAYLSSLIEAKQFNEALKATEQALEEYPENGEFWKLKGIILYETENFENAYASVLKSMELTKEMKRMKKTSLLFTYCACRAGKIHEARKFMSHKARKKHLRKALNILKSYEKK